MQIGDKKGEGLRGQLYLQEIAWSLYGIAVAIVEISLGVISHALIHVQTIVHQPYNAACPLNFASSQKLFVFFVEQCSARTFLQKPFQPAHLPWPING